MNDYIDNRLDFDPALIDLQYVRPAAFAALLAERERELGLSLEDELANLYQPQVEAPPAVDIDQVNEPVPPRRVIDL